MARKDKTAEKVSAEEVIAESAEETSADVTEEESADVTEEESADDKSGLVKVGETITHNPGEKTTREDVMVEADGVEVNQEPTPALVEDDVVTCRGEGFGGAVQMKRSEYDAQQKKAAK